MDEGVFFGRGMERGRDDEPTDGGQPAPPQQQCRGKEKIDQCRFVLPWKCRGTGYRYPTVGERRERVVG